IYDNEADSRGPMYITIGDGGNREGLALNFIKDHESAHLSVFREASFGHGRLRIVNETSAVWTWHRNDEEYATVRDELLIPCFRHRATESLPMEEPATLVADWSNLPADILSIVQGELEFPDLFRSASVCTSWRSAARSLRRHGLYSRPQTPCLLYSTAAAGTRAVKLYSLADKSTYTIPLPDQPIAERSIVGSSHGWLVTADSRSELHLLNPATSEQLALPPVATVEQVSPILDDAGNLQRYDLSFYDAALPVRPGLPVNAADELEQTKNTHEHLKNAMNTEFWCCPKTAAFSGVYFSFYCELQRAELWAHTARDRPPEPYAADKLRRFLYLKVVLSCDPSRGDCILMMIYNPYRQLAFARVGSKRWHWITTSFRESMYSDCIYNHDGAFYAMNRQGGIHRYTIEGSCATRDVIFKYTLPYTPAHNMYIARTSSGDVLQIWRITSCPIEDSLETHTTDIEMFKVDFDKQDIVDIGTLSGDALFIGHNCSCCLSTKDHPRLLSNHVYFTGDDE
ncbi:hypothetical protein BAE44_0007193, partial [Dichanthelium oligosanthes]